MHKDSVKESRRTGRAPCRGCRKETTQRHKIPIVCEGDKRMEKKKKTRFIVGWLLITAALLAGSLLVPGHGKSESVQEAMRDAVLHGTNRISLCGLKDVNPAYISSLVVVGVILLAAAQAGIPIYEYTPMQVKQAVTGYGKAVKKQVQEMTRILLHLPAVPKPDDTADALAMAITFCHTNGNQLNRFARRGVGPI